MMWVLRHTLAILALAYFAYVLYVAKCVSLRLSKRALRPGRRSWDHAMFKTLFLQAPSFDGFDGGAGSRYQAKREIRSFWFPTWLAQPAALVPESRVVDAPADDLSVAQCLEIAR